eukprot:1243111-Rhodomonas_salina.5
MSGTKLAYCAMRCLVLIWRMLLPGGEGLGSARRVGSLLWCYAMSGTAIALLRLAVGHVSTKDAKSAKDERMRYRISLRHSQY